MKRFKKNILLISALLMPWSGGCTFFGMEIGGSGEQVVGQALFTNTTVTVKDNTNAPEVKFGTNPTFEKGRAIIIVDTNSNRETVNAGGDIRKYAGKTYSIEAPITLTEKTN